MGQEARRGAPKEPRSRHLKRWGWDEETGVPLLSRLEGLDFTHYTQEGLITLR